MNNDSTEITNFCAFKINLIDYSISPQDWLKCRFNINYVDSSNIKIDFYPINNLESIPSKISNSFADFRFETAEDAHDTNLNVIALFWT